MLKKIQPQMTLGDPSHQLRATHLQQLGMGGMGWGQVTPLIGFQLMFTYSHQAIWSEVTSRLISSTFPQGHREGPSPRPFKPE